MRRFLALVSTVAVGVVALVAVPAGVASAAVGTVCPPADTRFWPTQGTVQSQVNGNQVTLRTSFSLDEPTTLAAQCKGAILKVFFVVQNGGATGVNYTFSTNLRYTPDTLASPHRGAVPSSFEPGTTSVNTYLLTANTSYFFQVSW